MRLVGNRRRNSRVRMSKYQRSPRANVIQQFVAIRVVKVLRVATLNNQRLPTDGTKRPDGAVHTANQNLLRAREYFAGSLAVTLHMDYGSIHGQAIKLSRR